MDNYQTKITCSNLFYFLHFFSYCTKIKQTIWNDPNCIKIDSKLYYNKVFYVYKPSIEYKSTKTANLGHISIIKKTLCSGRTKLYFQIQSKFTSTELAT